MCSSLWRNLLYQAGWDQVRKNLLGRWSCCVRERKSFKLWLRVVLPNTSSYLTNHTHKMNLMLGLLLLTLQLRQLAIDRLVLIFDWSCFDKYV